MQTAACKMAAVCSIQKKEPIIKIIGSVLVRALLHKTTLLRRIYVTKPSLLPNVHMITDSDNNTFPNDGRHSNVHNWGQPHKSELFGQLLGHSQAVQTLAQNVICCGVLLVTRYFQK